VIILDIAGNEVLFVCHLYKENNLPINGSPIICGNLGKCGNNVNSTAKSTVVRFNAMINGEVFSLG
jgi:hypothetical protein